MLNRIIGYQFDGFSIRLFFIMSGAGMLALLIWMGLKRIFSHQRFSMRRYLIRSLIWMYVCLLFQTTFYGRDSTGSKISKDLDFGSLTEGYLGLQQFVYSVLNTLMFVPWGMLIYLERKKCRFFEDMFKVFLNSFLFSLLIETVQLVTQTGYFEVADIILNTAGGVLGAILVAFFTRKQRKTSA